MAEERRGFNYFYLGLVLLIVSTVYRGCISPWIQEIETRRQQIEALRELNKLQERLKKSLK